MKYIIILATIVMMASCSQANSQSTNNWYKLSHNDSTFIQNIQSQEEKQGAKEFELSLMENTIQLTCLYKEYTRVYYLNRKGTVDRLMDFYPDGSVVDYGEESE
jgi:hypothetical protein